MDIPEEVVTHVCLGDEQAYEELFRLSWDQAVRTCWLVLRHQHDAEEVAQDSFLKLYMHRHQLKDIHAFRSWFYRILMNAALDKTRKRKSEVDIEQVHLPAKGDDIGEAENRVLIDEAMKQLSYEERVAFVLVHFIGYTEAEAAQTVRWGLGKLKYRLRRARNVVAQNIDGEAMKNGVNSKGGVQHV